MTPFINKQNDAEDNKQTWFQTEFEFMDELGEEELPFNLVKVFEFPSTYPGFGGTESMWVAEMVEGITTGIGLIDNDPALSRLEYGDLVSYSIDKKGIRRYQGLLIPKSELQCVDQNLHTEL